MPDRARAIRIKPMLRRVREWLSIRWNGACPDGGAHDWRTTLDRGYGQELVCLRCDGKGWLDYGR